MLERERRATVRLNDVAKLAGVSAATVSRVLNAPETVNQEARKRVEVAVQDLGYMRNGAARALRSRRSQIVGLIIPSFGHMIYSAFIAALEKALTQQNYSLIIASSGSSLDQELSQTRILAERGVDALVFIGHSHRAALFALLHAQDIPYVTTYSFKPHLRQPVVGFDNLAAAEDVASHLFDLGHRSFALLAGMRSHNDRVEDRVNGVLAALSRRGIALPARRIVEESLSVEGGRAGIHQLLATGDRPTAVICTSDMLAFGALIECASRSIAVPSEISVTGFDGLALSAHIDPPLTTIAVPAAEMGQQAGAYLLARLAGKPWPNQTAIPAQLVVRGTTAPPPD